MSYVDYVEIEIKTITIDEELNDYLRPLALDEFTKLKNSIINEGCRDPLVLWDKDGVNYLVDGHNRLEILVFMGIDKIKAVYLDFEDKNEVKYWIVENQLSKRNLTKMEVDYYIGKQFALKKSLHHSSPRNEVSKEYGISEKTVYNDSLFTEALDKLSEVFGSDIKADILSNNIKTTKKDVIDLVNNDEQLQKKVINSIRNYETDNLGTSIKKQSEILQKEYYSKATPANVIEIDNLYNAYDDNKKTTWIYDANEELYDVAFMAGEMLDDGEFFILMLEDDDVSEIIYKFSKNNLYYFKTFVLVINKSKNVKYKNIVTCWKPIIVFKRIENEENIDHILNQELNNPTKDLFYTNSTNKEDILNDCLSQLISVFSQKEDLIVLPSINKELFDKLLIGKEFNNREFMVLKE